MNLLKSKQNAYNESHEVRCERKDVREPIAQWKRSRKMMKGMGGNRKLNKQMRKMMKDGDMDMDPSALACERDSMRLYHNPRCSKSRQAVALLTEAGYDFEMRLYLNEGIAQEDLEILASVENIIRANDVVGDVDVSMLDSKEFRRYFPINQSTRATSLDSQWSSCSWPSTRIDSQPFRTSIGLGEKNSALGWFSTHMTGSFFRKIIG